MAHSIRIGVSTVRASVAAIAVVSMTILLAVTPASAGSEGFTSGASWTTRSSAADVAWNAVAHGAGRFVAVGNNRIMTSTDGVNWTAINSPASRIWTGVTYGDGKFVAVASNAPTGTKQTMSSADGLSWTMGSDLSSTGPWRSVAYAGGQFVAVGGASGLPPTGVVMYSSNGVDWTVGVSPSNAFWDGITHTGTNWVAVATQAQDATKRVMTSTDGISWTVRTTPSAGWQSVVYDGGRLVAVSTAGKTMYSDDNGVTWTQSTSGVPVNDWRSVTVGMTSPRQGQTPVRRFVAIADSGTGNRAMYSDNGIDWTVGTSSADNDWNGIGYGDGKFVAVADSGTGTRVMTSNPVFLTASGNTLTIVPPSGSTSPAAYVVHYNSPTRITNGQSWGIWANKWPVANTSIDLAAYQAGTLAPCGVAPTTCPRAIGQHTPGTTMVYRVIAGYTTYGYQSAQLSVTRPS